MTSDAPLLWDGFAH